MNLADFWKLVRDQGGIKGTEILIKLIQTKQLNSETQILAMIKHFALACLAAAAQGVKLNHT